MPSKKSRKKTEQGLRFADGLIASMLAVVVGLMPLIVRFTLRPLPPEIAHLYPQYPDGLYPDVFTYGKSWLLILPAIVIALYSVSDWATRGKMPDYKTFFKKPPVILSLAYLAFVIISAIASPYSHTSLWGTYDRGEGLFIWLAYFTVFFAAMLSEREKRYIKFFLRGLIFSSIIMGAIGVSQFIGRDFFNTGLAEWLVTAGTRGRGLDPAFEIAHGTLFNPNTFGKYTAMISPFLLLGALTYDGGKVMKILMLAAGGLMLLGVFGSSSLGGLVGIVTATGVLTVTYFCGFIYRKKAGAGSFFSAKRLAIAAGGVVGAIALAILFITPLNDRVMFLFNRLGDAVRAETVTIRNYIFEEDTLHITLGQNRLASVTVHGLDEADWLTVRDGGGQRVPLAQRVEPEPIQEGEPQFLRPVVYIYDVPGYGTLSIDRYEELFFYRFFLTFRDGRIYGLHLHDLHEHNAPIDFAEHIPAWGFYGRETWGSNRGYIWSRSFPLMPSRAIIGTGPDTFINVFPQQELVAKQRFFHTPYITVDKAHNLFIQTWITTGGISAILLFSLFGHYLFTTFISLVKSKNEPLSSYGLRLGLLSGISAFVMSSMATDSTIGSTGVFFALLGLGYGMNAWLGKR